MKKRKLKSPHPAQPQAALPQEAVAPAVRAEAPEIGVPASSEGAAQSSLVVFTAGTPGGGWLELADRVLAGAPDDVNLRRHELRAWLDALPDTVSRPPTPALQAALAALAPAHTAIWGGVDSRACWVLDVLAEAYPQARFLLFVAAPTDALAESLAPAALDALAPQALLALWREGAARLLRHAQRHPGRCLLVDAREAAAEPDAMAAVCSGQLGLAFSPPPGDVEAVDPLLQALATSLVAQDRDTLELYTELRASCFALTSDDTVGVEGPGFDSEQVAFRFRALAAAAVAAPVLASQLDLVQQQAESTAALLQLAADNQAAAQSELERFGLAIEARTVEANDLERKLADAQGRLAAAQESLARQSVEHAAQFEISSQEMARLQLEAQAARQGELAQALNFEAVSAQLQQQHQQGQYVLLNLNQLQEELGSTWDTLRDTERRLAETEPKLKASEAAAARLAAELESAHKLAAQLEALNEDKSRLLAERDGALEQTTALQLQAEDAVARQEQLAAAAVQQAAMQQQVEMLLRNLQRVQEDLESTWLRLRDTERRLAETEPKLKASETAALKLANERSAAAQLAAESAAQVEALSKDTVRLIAERDAAVEQARARQVQAEDVKARHELVARELAASAVQHASMQQQLDLLLPSLNRAQEELESTWDKLRDTERRMAETEPKLKASEAAATKLASERSAAAQLAAERAAQVEALSKDKVRLTAERDAAVEQVRVLQVQVEDSKARRELDARELAASGVQHASMQQQLDMLLLSLNRVQEELESTWDKLRDTERRMAETEPKLKASEAAAAKLATERSAAAQLAAERAAQVEGLSKDRVRLTAERDAAIEQARVRQVQAEDARARHELVARELAASGVQHASMQQQLEMLLPNLNRVQDELGSTWGRLRDTERRMAETEPKLKASEAAVSKLAAERSAATNQAAELAAQVEALNGERLRLLAELNAAAQQAKERQLQLDDALARHQPVAHELEAALARDASRQQENEMLLLHLHQVQEELEKYYLELQQLKERPPESPAVGPAGTAAEPLRGLSVGRVSINSPRETPPHRELEFILEHISIDGAEDLPELRMRLVEHHGRAGIAFFAGPGRKPLQRWRESGQEQGQPYMLMVPADQNAWPLLRGLSLQDWNFLLQLVALSEHGLRADAPDLAPRWAGVASRLRRELIDFPPAARYQAVDVAAVPGGLNLRLSPVQWGLRQLAAVQIHLPAAGEGIFDLVLDDAVFAEPPLVGWPMDDAGVPLVRMTLQPGAGAAPESSLWAALPATDREFLLSLLACLPEVAASLPSGAEATVLAAQAAALLRPATSPAAARAPGAGRLIRRLLGREQPAS